MNRILSQRPFALFLATVGILSLVAAPAQATSRPHVSRGTAQFTATGFVGAGTATHLGNYGEVGTVTLIPTADPAVFDFIDATATYTSANGDELHARFTGQLNAATGVITATVTYVGGTGRFASASGTGTLSGQILDDGSLEIVVNATIDY